MFLNQLHCRQRLQVIRALLVQPVSSTNSPESKWNGVLLPCTFRQALNLRKRTLQVLEEGFGIDALTLVPRPASVITLNKQGGLLRAWHALDGTLLWEKPISGGPSTHPPSLLVLPDVTGDGSSEIAVATGQQLQACPLLICLLKQPGICHDMLEIRYSQDFHIT